MVVLRGASAVGPIGLGIRCARRKELLLLIGAIFIWALAIGSAWPSSLAWQLALASLPVEFVVVGARHVGRVV